MAPRWLGASVLAHVVLLGVFALTNGPWHPRVPQRTLAYLLDLQGPAPQPDTSHRSYAPPRAARRGTVLSLARPVALPRDTAPGDPEGIATGDTASTSPVGRPGVSGLALLSPRYADERLWVRPLIIPEDGSRPISLDSVTRAWFRVMADSMDRHPELNPNYNPYAPRPWTFERNGRTYGIDAAGLHLGSFTIPSALLALIAFPQGNIDQARASTALMAMRAEMLRAAARAQTEEDFRRAVRGIRERNDRERRERRERDANRPRATP